MRRRPFSACAALGASAVLLVACSISPTERSSTDTSTSEAGASETAAEADPAPVVTVANAVLDASDSEETAEDSAPDPTAASGEQDADAADDAASTEAAAASDDTDLVIAAGEPLQLEIDGGDFESVELIDLDHASVPTDSGETEGQAEWASAADLATGVSYQWEATTTAPDGGEHIVTGAVSTPETTAQEELTARTVISDGEDVGVAAPIVVRFNSTIPEEGRNALESRLSVDVTDAAGAPVEVEGSWGWLYDTDGQSRVHFRPKEFWPANVDVSVGLPLEGVEYSPRWYGKEDLTLDFHVDRDQRVTADAETHRMVIERDGEEIEDWPTSLGKPAAPSSNGIHIVMEKHEHYVMTSENWGYETPTNWAVRIHNNGEFVHGAPWSAAQQGHANVSHGCINLTDERAREYYEMALYGDPVEIVNSSTELTTEHSDISDWVYEWDEWQELSALS